MLCWKTRCFFVKSWSRVIVLLIPSKLMERMFLHGVGIAWSIWINKNILLLSKLYSYFNSSHGFSLETVVNEKIILCSLGFPLRYHGNSWSCYHLWFIYYNRVFSQQLLTVSYERKLSQGRVLTLETYFIIKKKFLYLVLVSLRWNEIQNSDRDFSLLNVRVWFSTIGKSYHVISLTKNIVN